MEKLRERHMVSQWKQASLLSELSDRFFCLTVEKLWLEALGTCWRAVSHASLSSRLAVDGRHESVWIRCSMDGGVIRARAKVQI